MEDTLAQLYDEEILLHEVVAPLVGIKNKAQEVLKLVKVENKVVNQIQEWVSNYLDVPQQLFRKNNVSNEVEKVQLRLRNQNYIYLGEQSTNTIVAYR